MFNRDDDYDDDDDTPSFDPSKANGRTLREMLIKLHADQDAKMKIPLYKEGYEEGFKMGSLGASEDARQTMLGIFRIFDRRS